MKSIDIYYFSGTGNTKLIIEKLQEQLDSCGAEVNLISIEEVLNSGNAIEVDQCEMLGLAYPIHGFGTSPLVQKFITKLPEGNGLKLFILKTAADLLSINHNASTKSIIKLEKSGYDVFYDRIIVMPSNWFITYSNAFNQQLLDCSTDKVKHMCLDLLDGNKRRYKTGRIMKSISYFIADREERFGAPSFGQSLRTNSSCTTCGLCVEKCPVKNITLSDGNIVFGDKCIWCMRCIYNCPGKAIDSRGYSFCVLKNGYNLDKIQTAKINPKKRVTPKTKGYFKHFYKYMQDESL